MFFALFPGFQDQWKRFTVNKKLGKHFSFQQQKRKRTFLKISPNLTLLRVPNRGEDLSYLGEIGCVEKFPLVDFQALFSHLKTWIYMELWWNLDIYDGIWTFHDGIWTFYDGKLTNWPCWSEGKVGTEPFTWLGQGFHFNFSEIPFQKRENLSIYGQNYGHLRSFTAFLTVFQSKQNRFNIHPCFLQCFAEHKLGKFVCCTSQLDSTTDDETHTLMSSP